MSLLALEMFLDRGIKDADVKNIVHTLIDEYGADKSFVEDLLVLTFRTRDVRGGKGLRDATGYLLKALLEKQQTKNLTLDLLDLLPEYGCWKDMFKLLPPSALSRALEIIRVQFLNDEAAVSRGEKPSLLAKWLPREGQPYAFYVVAQIVPGQMFQWTRMKLYRKRLAALNRALNTVEIKMCANQWSAIVPKEVPSGALKKYKKAFLHSSDLDCANRFLEHFNRLEDQTPIKEANDSRYNMVRVRVRAFFNQKEEGEFKYF